MTQYFLNFVFKLLNMQFLYARIAETTYPTPPARKEHTAMIWKENRENTYCEITPELLALKQQWEKKNYIDPKLYK